MLPVTTLVWSTRRRRPAFRAAFPNWMPLLGKKVISRALILVTGTAGTGKTSVVAHFADAACRRGERCYFAFEVRKPFSAIWVL